MEWVDEWTFGFAQKLWTDIWRSLRPFQKMKIMNIASYLHLPGYRHSSGFCACRRAGFFVFFFRLLLFLFSLLKRKRAMFTGQRIVLKETSNLEVSPRETLEKGLALRTLSSRYPCCCMVRVGGTKQLQQEWFLSASRLLGNKGRISDKWKWSSKARSFARWLSQARDMTWFWHPTSTCALGGWRYPSASPDPLGPCDQETRVIINIHVSDTMSGCMHYLI